MSVEALEAFIAKGIAAQDAADREAGRPTATEADRDALIGELRVQLQRDLTAASDLICRARRTFDELVSDAVYDVDYAETVTGSDVGHFIDTARRSVAAGCAIAAGMGP